MHSEYAYVSDLISILAHSTFIQRRQSLGFYRRLLGPVSDHVLINRASRERALRQVITYYHDTI